MRNFIVFLSVVCLALGVAAFASPSDAAWGGKSSTSKEAAVDPDAPPPEFEYVQLDPLNLPIITSKGLTQQVSLLVSLEITYGDKNAVIRYKPRLADAYLQDLYGALGTGVGLMRGNVIDVPQIKERLTSVTNKVLGPDLKVRDVLLQVVQQHPK